MAVAPLSTVRIGVSMPVVIVGAMITPTSVVVSMVVIRRPIGYRAADS